MKLLMCEQDFRKWAITKGFEYDLSLTKRKAIEIGISWPEKKAEQDVWFSKNSPKEYPCLGYSQLIDFNAQECGPLFLYAEDLRKFLIKMDAAGGKALK